MKPVDPRLLRASRPVRMLLVALTGLGVADAVLLIVQATLLADVISQFVTAPHAETGARTTDAVLALIAASAGRALLSWVREVAAVRTGARVKSALRADLIGRFVRGPIRAADRERTGESAVLATRGLEAMDGYFSRYLPQLTLAAVVPALIGIRILAADPLSAVIIAVTVPLIPVFMVLIGLRTRAEMDRRFTALQRLGGHFLEVVAGLPTLAAFGRTRGQERQIRRAADAHRRATMRTLRIAFLSSLALELIAMLSVALVAAAIGLRLADGSLDLRTGLLVLVCAPEVYLPLRQVGARYHEAAEGLAAADQVFGLTEDEAAREDKAVHAQGGGAVPEDLRIRFEQVTVSRKDRPDAARAAIDLAPAPGLVTGLVGPSGAGKSTLLHLLLGFDRPSAGRITVGGIDLSELDPQQWRAKVAWVPQRPRLTGDTVAEAIRLGAPDSDGTAVAEAAARAGIDFPLDTPLGEGALALSGGQARRVALARAILKDTPIVLLDEPTEHLDPHSEQLIVEALRNWLPGRTALVITHRPRLLELCDEVVRLDAAPSSATPSSAVAQTPHAELPPPEAGDTKRLRWRLLGAGGLGAGAALCGIGLAGASAWLTATAASHPPVLTLQVGIAAVQAFGFGRAVLRYGERLAGHDATLRILTELRVRVYRGLVRRAPAGMAGASGGELLSGMTADVEAVQDVLLKTLLPAVGVVTACVGLLAVEAVALPAAALVIGSGIGVAVGLAPAVTRWLARRAEARTAEARAAMTANVVGLLDALPDLVAFGAADERAARVVADDARLTALERRGAFGSGVGAGLIAVASGATCAVLAGLCAHAVSARQVGGPLAAALVLAPLALFELCAPLPDATRAVDRGVSAWRRLNAAMQAQPVVAVPDQPADLAWTATSVLEFDDVAASWPDTTRLAVHDVTFRLRAGEQAVITGPSGSGKSTTAALAARFLDPVHGSVRIDGTDLRGADPGRVREIVTVVDQDAHLFDATIRENLRIGRPDAGEDELWDALAAVSLDAWVRTLPRGLDTEVGVAGDAVSGGEGQRICLARGLLSRAPVLVLDEPTAHLDADTAAVVLDRLRARLDGRTVLWIRHDAGQSLATEDQCHDNKLVRTS